MSAREAWAETPSWELEVLQRARRREIQEIKKGQR